MSLRDEPIELVDWGAVCAVVARTCVGMLASAELAVEAAAEETRLDSVVGAEELSSEGVIVEDGRVDTAVIDACGPSERLSS